MSHLNSKHKWLIAEDLADAGVENASVATVCLVVVYDSNVLCNVSHP